MQSSPSSQRISGKRTRVPNTCCSLPSSWSNFIALSENKADLAHFLSQQLIVQAPHSKVIVAAGGFSNEEMVESSHSDINTEPLEARHEEADTKIVLQKTTQTK